MPTPTKLPVIIKYQGRIDWKIIERNDIARKMEFFYPS